jgi:hypothetical protein
MSFDEQIGRNLATLRGAISQRELSTKMRELGFKARAINGSSATGT